MLDDGRCGMFATSSAGKVWMNAVSSAGGMFQAGALATH